MVIRKEIRDFITISEKIHSLIAQGEKLNEDERSVLQECTSELQELIGPADESTSPS